MPPRAASGDLFWFVALFALAVAIGTPHLRAYRWPAAAVLIAGYLAYAIQTMRHGAGGAPAHAPERFVWWRPRRPPPLFAIVGVAVAAVLLLLAGAESFVRAVTILGPALGISHLVLAVVLAPLATELPEVVNSVVWTWHGRDDLALSAVTGAMIIQGTVGPTLGIALTGWRLGPTEQFAALLALAAAAFFAFGLRLYRRLEAPPLLLGAAFYALFLVAMALP